MSYKLELTPNFRKEAKKLSKKYPSLKDDLILLFATLEQHPESGTPLGNNLYKIRINIASKGKGKRGGARVITYVKTEENLILLLSIYNKGTKDSISDKDLKNLLESEGP